MLDKVGLLENYYTIMHFEFDAEKSKSNLTKHRIDFEQAQTLWRDADGLAVPSKYSGESRMLWSLPGRQDHDYQRATGTRERTERVL